MTFLQPFVLWALPLIVVPVIIHLINRMRYRSVPWAAMMFLLSATRSSTRYARLKQILILCCRVLAVLTLVLALSRPLVGGWMGWLLSPAPDAILLLLDRSASMERRSDLELPSKRKQALKLLADAGQKYAGISRILLIENGARQPQEVAGLVALPELSLVSATETAADLPAMLETALQWLADNKMGTAEIWVASDLQRSNWRPDDRRWNTLASACVSMVQRLRVRLLALSRNRAPDASVSIQKVDRRRRGGQSELDLEIGIQRDPDSPSAFPLVIVTDGARSRLDVTMPNPALVMHHRVSLGAKHEGGWCQAELPSDANESNNRGFWVYPAEIPLRGVVASADPPSGRFLRLATAPVSRDTRQTCDLISPSQFEGVDWKETALAVWQDVLPEGETARQLHAFLERGGTLIFFPPASADSHRFGGMGWGDVESAVAEKPFRVARWEEKEGPLAKTEEGMSLPLPELNILRRQRIVGSKSALAFFADGEPFLARQPVGKGTMFFCASLPRGDWSNLNAGTVLVPMMQRLLAMGGRCLGQPTEAVCGEWSPPIGSGTWRAEDGSDSKDPRFRAGVYRSGSQRLAVNRPVAEDDREIVEINTVKALFGNVPVQVFEQPETAANRLQSEIWRTFLVIMMLALLVEGILILPVQDEKKGLAAGIWTRR